MQKSLLIFDLDGTLLDTRADLTTAVNMMRADYSLPALSVSTVTSHLGNGLKKQTERALQDWSAILDACPELSLAVQKCREYYSQNLCVATKPYPKVISTLEKLCKTNRFKLAVITNKPDAEAKKLCTLAGIAKYFDIILGGGICQHLKPHPETLFKVINDLSADSANCWMFGDNYTDLGAARRANIAACFCNYGFGKIADEKVEFQIDHFDELLQLPGIAVDQGDW